VVSVVATATNLKLGNMFLSRDHVSARGCDFPSRNSRHVRRPQSRGWPSRGWGGSKPTHSRLLQERRLAPSLWQPRTRLGRVLNVV